MKALILAAGYATRLYPLTKDFPKPLLEVGGEPIINYLVEKINRLAGIDTILVITNDRFFGHFQEWSRRIQSDKRIKVLNDQTKDEKSRRGAIGDIHYTIKQEGIDEDLIVVGGDNLFDGSLDDFVNFARTKEDSPCIGLYDVGRTEDAEKYGVVYIDAENRIFDFKEKPKRPSSTLVAMCLYYFPQSKIGLIEEYMGERKDKDASGFYIEWLKDRCPVYGFIFSGRWFDIGHYEFYNEARRQFDRKG